MTNEEKTKEIADFLYFKLNHIDYNTLKRELLAMAQWKDEQFKKFLREICFVSEKFINEKFDKINEL